MSYAMYDLIEETVEQIDTIAECVRLIFDETHIPAKDEKHAAEIWRNAAQDWWDGGHMDFDLSLSAERGWSNPFIYKHATDLCEKWWKEEGGQ